MGDEVRLLGDRLRISPSLAEPLDPTLFTAADALSRASREVLSPNPADLFTSSPRWSLRVHGTADSTLSVGAGMALPSLIEARRGESTLDTAARIAADPSLARAPRALARAGFELSYTPEVLRPDLLSTSVTIRADATVDASALSLDQLTREAGPLLSQASEIERTARDLTRRQADLMELLNGPDMRRLRAALAGGVSAANAPAILALAEPLLDRLRDAITFLNDTQSFLQGVDTLLGDAHRFEQRYTARAGARGAVEVDYSFRHRILDVRRGDTSVRLTVGATVGVTSPLANPDPSITSAIPGLRAFRTMMTTVQAVATVSYRGLEQMRGALSDLAQLASDAETLARTVSRNPLGLIDPARARAAERQANELQSRAGDVSTRVNRALGEVGVDVAAGMRTTEATGVGGGLRELGASLDVTHGDFDLNVAVVLRNLVGYLPGQYTDYVLTEEAGQQGLRVTGESTGNVFSVFYPSTVAVNGSIRYRPSDRVSFELRGGLETARSGPVGVANAGFMARIHALYLGVGVVAPLGSPGVTPTMAATVGVQTPNFQLGVSASANTEVFAQPDRLNAASFELSMTHRF